MRSCCLHLGLRRTAEEDVARSLRDGRLSEFERVTGNEHRAACAGRAWLYDRAMVRCSWNRPLRGRRDLVCEEGGKCCAGEQVDGKRIGDGRFTDGRAADADRIWIFGRLATSRRIRGRYQATSPTGQRLVVVDRLVGHTDTPTVCRGDCRSESQQSPGGCKSVYPVADRFGCGRLLGGSFALVVVGGDPLIALADADFGALDLLDLITMKDGMYLGYNTNGLAHEPLADAIELLAKLGYQGVAITLDHGALDPFDEKFDQLPAIKELLDQHGMRTVVETGARFLLDPEVKHEPTLVSHGFLARKRRVDFLSRAIVIAKQLGSDCVSLWSGAVKDDANEEAVWDRLIHGLTSIADLAAGNEMAIGFEPEPDMFIDTLDKFQELLDRSSLDLKLTMDVGHVHCSNEGDIPTLIHHWQERLVNVHIEDMRRGVHEHLMFGEGQMDFPPILAALAEVNYQGGVFVELSRHSDEGPAAAKRAFEFMAPLVR